MRVSTRARYALRLMIDLAEHWVGGSPVVLRDVARRQGISKRYLEQMASTLRSANLVTSVLGRAGGYALPRPPKEITAGDVIEATIGRVNLVGCVNRPEICPRSDDCRSRDMWARISQAINSVLDSVTLDKLCDGPPDLASPARRRPMITPCGPHGARESP